MKVGTEILVTAQQYVECTNTDFCTLDTELSKVVFTQEKMEDDYEAVIDGCLMKLPVKYLDIVNYGEPHTKWSEFTIRVRYMRYHTNSLHAKEIKEVLEFLKMEE